MEKVELDAQIAAVDAKDEAEPHGDGMNANYEEASKIETAEPKLTETSALEYIQLATEPKTPLQRAVGNICLVHNWKILKSVMSLMKISAQWCKKQK